LLSLLIGVALAVLVLGSLDAARAAGPAGTPLFGSINLRAQTALVTSRKLRVRRIRAGAYKLTIVDRSSRCNFHLMGPNGWGRDRQTGITFVGKKVWNVRLTPGSYRYRCDRNVRSSTKTFVVT
jgi:hypothetical protein